MTAVGATVSVGRPDLASPLAPWDDRLKARHAQYLILSRGPADTAAMARAGALAAEPAASEPVSALAHSALATVAMAQGRTAEGARGFAYAERLSRRDLAAQLFRIEEAVARGDVAAALRHYDIALSTNSNASTLLFPVLGNTLGNAEIAPALLDVLGRGPSWRDSFLTFAALKAPDAASAAAFLDAAAARGLPVTREQQRQLIARLLTQKQGALAWRRYASLTPGASSRGVRNADFSAAPDAPLAFDWAPVDTPGISTLIEARDGKGALYVDAPGSASGPALAQWQVLAPGRYTLRWRTAAGATESRLSLRMDCGGGRVLPATSPAPVAGRSGEWTSTVTLPASCTSQRLMVWLASRSGGSSAEQVLTFASIEPV